jgi:hypothetical protein
MLNRLQRLWQLSKYRVMAWARVSIPLISLPLLLCINNPRTIYSLMDLRDLQNGLKS